MLAGERRRGPIGQPLPHRFLGQGEELGQLIREAMA